MGVPVTLASLLALAQSLVAGIQSLTAGSAPAPTAFTGVLLSIGPGVKTDFGVGGPYQLTFQPVPVGPNLSLQVMHIPAGAVVYQVYSFTYTLESGYAEITNWQAGAPTGS
jgi:hypothetical protein